VAQLDFEARVDEIARMIGGAQVTDAARSTARDLLAAGSDAGEGERRKAKAKVGGEEIPDRNVRLSDELPRLGAHGRLLDQAGYEATSEDSDADVIVINTCSVRERAEEKLYTRLGELRVLAEETGHRPVVAVAGCVAQQEGQALLRKSTGHVIDVVIGTQQLKMLPVLVANAAQSATAEVNINPWDDVTFPLGITRRSDPLKAYVTIIEGCNDHCAFCVVPYTRGHERMRAKADILADVREAVETGRKEIQLLGQIVNHYLAPDDPACDFAQLLEDVNEIPGVERIRLRARIRGTRARG
jgi:tRNA-2-methylthio-N6-dimethylallyladenosine synthase